MSENKTEKAMKFYVFAKGDRNTPSSRYRAYYLAEALEELGYEVQLVLVTERGVRSFFKYLRILLQRKSSDVIYLQRTIYNKFFTVSLFLVHFLLRKRYIFDIDDAVYEHRKYKTWMFVQSRHKTIWYVRYAALVTCGSEKIQAWTKQYNPRSYVVANSLPMSVYSKREREPEGVPVIGWIGSLPAAYVPVVIPALQELHKRGYEFQLKVIGAMGDQKIRKQLAGIPNVTVIDSLNWSDPTEAVREIKTFHIGIMPLTKESWAQAKYFKALEYMACSVPVVVSPGQTVREIVEVADSGFVAADTNEWVEKLALLLDNKSKREEFGARGRNAIEKKYSNIARARELIKLISKES